MYVGLIILVLIQAINVYAFNYVEFGTPVDPIKANWLIARADAGLLALRLKIRLLGGPEFLVGSHIEELHTDSVGIPNDHVPVPTTVNTVNVKFWQRVLDVGTVNWNTKVGTVGRGRAMCISTSDTKLNVGSLPGSVPSIGGWETGNLACAIIRLDSHDCDGSSYIDPMVGIGHGLWGAYSAPMRSIFIYCE